MQKTPGKWLLLAGGIVLVMALIVGIMGRGWFSNLGSNAFGNVCSRASLESGKVRYEQGSLDLIKLSSEKNQLTKIVSVWKQEIKKNESQIKKFESEKKIAEKTIWSIEKILKKSCTSVTKTITVGGGRGGSTQPNPVYEICETKKRELTAAQRDLKQAEASLSKEAAQNKKRTATIKNAESRIRALDNQIQDITSYRTGYDACRWTISG